MSLSGLEGTGIPSLSLKAKGTSQIQSAWVGVEGSGNMGAKLTVNGSLQRLQKVLEKRRHAHACWVTPQMEPSFSVPPSPSPDGDKSR